MKIEPILHRVLVKPDVLEEVDKDYKRFKAMGLEIVGEREREQAAIDTGTVLAIGETAFRDFGTTSPFKVGDRIVYAKYGGKAVHDHETNTKYVLLNDEDCIALITTEEEPKNG